MGPLTSYFPVIFYFQRIVGGGVGENGKNLNIEQINVLFVSSDGVGQSVQRILI
jgi:hypothetical protein